MDTKAKKLARAALLCALVLLCCCAAQAAGFDMQTLPPEELLSNAAPDQAQQTEAQQTEEQRLAEEIARAVGGGQAAETSELKPESRQESETAPQAASELRPAEVAGQPEAPDAAEQAADAGENPEENPEENPDVDTDAQGDAEPADEPEVPEGADTVEDVPLDEVYGMAQAEPAVLLRSARIRAAGDLMMHAKQLECAKTSKGYDFHPQYALIYEELANADYTIANLETTVGLYGSMDYSGYPLFNAPESLLETIRDAGVDFLTLANNHMLDRYFDGMVTTVNNVEAYGFDHGGANRTQEEHDAPVIVEVNGIHIGMLCYTEMTNDMESFCDPKAKEFGVNYLGKADIAADVKKLREAGAEAIIAIPHWGLEYFRYPEDTTIAMAKKMVAAGVDVVLGSHPHMVQPVKYVTATGEDGVERRGLVAYSLGNFISAMTKQYTDSGIILEFTLREQQDGSFRAEDVGVIPVYCWKTEKNVRAVSSMKYFSNAPEGMSSGAHGRLRETCRELRALIDEDIPFIDE